MRLNVLEGGEGPPVALLHGLFGQARNFGALSRALSARHRVLAMDARNHGDSPHDAGMDFDTMAADAAETLRGLGARPAALVGHSMGGKIAMRLALTDPGAVSRLLVADIAPVPNPPTIFRDYIDAMRGVPLRPGLSRREADAALAAAVPDPMLRGFLLQSLRLDAEPPRWRIGLEEIAAALPDIENWAPLPAGTRYDGPVLVVRGGRSDYIRPEHEAAFRALFPQARFAVLEKAGHWVHVEDPAGFQALVQDFLDEG
ncbi:alpha/beta fold hydrolase [Roseomonas sp. BN140053]|uniref:alpha/beta fold hydrolase n=1 Tax=Roseomonas sp. BN140053 TaxID=3391898 RepID=UPI0039EB5846